MSREKKAQVIDRLEEEITKCSVGILTDYRGLSAAEITTLRRTLEEAADRHAATTHGHAHTADRHAGSTHSHARAADQHTGSTHGYAHAADQHRD